MDTFSAQSGTGATRQTENSAQTSMQVRKRNGALEPVDINKIVRAITRCCAELPSVDSLRIATKTISGLYDGATTKELDKLSIQTSASLIFEEPEYSLLAARLLNQYIEKEVRNQEIHSFSQSIAFGVREGLIGERVANFVIENSRKLNDAIDQTRNDLFEFFGLRTLYDRYLLKNPANARRYRVAAVFLDARRVRLWPKILTKRSIFINFSRRSNTFHRRRRSSTRARSTNNFPRAFCWTVRRTVSIVFTANIRMSPCSRSFRAASASPIIGSAPRGSLIRGTNGHSNGIVPWLKTLDSSVAAVNQGGKRKGACCVYLETWHADIEDFLELRDNTGDEASRTHNLNLANWIPDLFMKRVQADGIWSLFDPKVVPHFPDLYGEEFEAAYLESRRRWPVYATGQRPRPVREDDADDGSDRQRLDDL